MTTPPHTHLLGKLTKSIGSILVTLIVIMPCWSMSIIFPTYSTPVLVGDKVVVLSVDRKEVIGLEKTGKELWRQKLASKAGLIVHQTGKLLIVQDASVRSLHMKDGSSEPLFRANPEVEWVHYSKASNLFWGTRDDPEPSLSLFDGTTYALLATETLGENLAYADSDIVVIVKGNRKKSESGGYHFTKSWLEAFDRKSMKNLWSVPFEKDSWPHRYFVRCGDFIVCDDASDLIITHIKTGMMQRSPAEMPKDALGPSGLRAENGMLTYLASTMNYQDFNQSEKTLYKLSIPDLKIIDKKVVKVIEAVYSEKAGDLLITDALYRTACFRADGSKLWERFQLHRTPVVDGVIYFSDYHEGTARMGALDVATGKQQFFLSEKVEKK